MTSDNVYDVFMKARSLSGFKKSIYLNHHPEVKIFLKYALNPYITYGITNPVYSGRGTNNFKTSKVKELLDALAERRLTGAVAAMEVRRVQEALTPKSALLLGLILDKKLRIGLQAKSVNKIWPGLIPTHDVMLAQKYDSSRVKFPCRSEPKLDGLRGTYIDGDFYTRKGLKLYGLEVIKEEMKSRAQYEWDGELEIPGCTFQKASGLLRSFAKTPNAIFTIFACRTDMYAVSSFVPTEHVKLITRTRCDSLEDIQECYEHHRDQGYEGSVIKPLFDEYEGKRSWQWMKRKPLEDGEYVVIGAYEGEGKYVGMLGGLIVDFHGQPNKVGGGFTDYQRQKFWECPPIGQMVTVEYMEKTDDGNMRHSRFKDIRWDK